MRHPEHPFRALAWIAGSAFFFSWMSVFVKGLSRSGLPGPEIVLFRVLLNFAFTAAVMLVRRERFFPKGDRWLLLFRGVCGFVAVSSLFYSVSNLPLPVASILYWSSPLFVLVFSRFIFREALPRGTGHWTLVAFAGLVMLLKVDVRQGWSAYPLTSVAIGLLGSVSGALAYMAVRAATARVGVNGIIAAFTGVSTVLALPWALKVYQTPTGPQVGQILGMGACAILGQYLMTEGYRYAAAGVVSTLNLLNAAYAALFGWLLFGEILEFGQFVGLALLTLGIASVTLSAGKRAPIEV